MVFFCSSFSHCDWIPSRYFHLLCAEPAGVQSSSFYPQPCPAPLSSDSLQFPAVLLSRWRIMGGSIKVKQGGIHSIACICSLYLFAMANPCELEEAGDLLYVDMWGTCGAVFLVLIFTLSKQGHSTIILWALALNSAHIIALYFHFEIKHSPRKV